LSVVGVVVLNSGGVRDVIGVVCRIQAFTCNVMTAA
jgi:hypothetical protein